MVSRAIYVFSIVLQPLLGCCPDPPRTRLTHGPVFVGMMAMGWSGSTPDPWSEKAIGGRSSCRARAFFAGRLKIGYSDFVRSQDRVEDRVLFLGR